MANTAGLPATVLQPQEKAGSRGEAELAVSQREGEEEEGSHLSYDIYMYSAEGSWKRGREEHGETDEEGSSCG